MPECTLGPLISTINVSLSLRCKTTVSEHSLLVGIWSWNFVSIILLIGLTNLVSI